MSNKYKILELLKQNELTIKEISDKSEFNENEIRVYIHRLKDDGLIREIGKKNRYIIYAAIEKENIENHDLIDKLVLLMVKAGINSKDYGIDIKESEIQFNINRLMESGKIGWFFKI